MTTIATDGKTIAADGLRCAGQEIISKTTRKIVCRSGLIFAFTGAYALLEPMIAWYLEGADPSAVPKTETDKGSSLIIIKHGPVLLKVSIDLPYPEEFPFPQSFGSGCEYAQAAMKRGHTPREAVEVAAECNIYTGGEIMELDIAATLAKGEAVRTLAGSIIRPRPDGSADVSYPSEHPNGRYRGLDVAVE